MRRLRSFTAYLGASIVAVNLLSGCAGWQGLKLIVAGDSIEEIEVSEAAYFNEDAPDILLLAMDGVDRDLLYDMLRADELPELAALLGGPDNDFEHAYFEDDLQSTLPSSTGVSWATMMTGVQPAEHGITGNEYFIRDAGPSGKFAAPVPVTVDKVDPVLRIYTEGYANDLLEAPTVYEKMREREPGIHITVALHQYYAGADELILADRSALAEAFTTFVSDETVGLLSNKQSLSVFSEIDAELFENLTETIDVGSTAEVMTIYIPGIDHFAHISDMGPDEARRLYLKEAVEPLIYDLAEELREDGEYENRYVIITSDHGHTQVPHEDKNSLAAKGKNEPPALLEAAGFSPRPFSLQVGEDVYFDTVLAYQGALAFVYVADQSTCPIKGVLCDWRQPAREQDIHQVAQVFFQNNQKGDRIPLMQDTLDMVLVRTGPSEDASGPVFDVYLGEGRTQPLAAYLAAHPHPGYLNMTERLQNLTLGPYGNRAGDVILVAHNGDRKEIAERYYFASLYHSWHGSPSIKDTQVPFILAHPTKKRAELQSHVSQAMQADNSVAAVTRLLLSLRESERD